MRTNQTPVEAETTTLDDLHAEAVERAMTFDRERADHGGTPFLRRMIEHEMCPPGACIAWPAGTIIAVHVMGDGIRLRQPIVAPFVAGQMSTVVDTAGLA
jgi:hypothetical protein